LVRHHARDHQQLGRAGFDENMDEVAPLSLNGGQITTGSAGQFRPYGTVKVLPPATSTIVGNVLLVSDW